MVSKTMGKILIALVLLGVAVVLEEKAKEDKGVVRFCDQCGAKLAEKLLGEEILF